MSVLTTERLELRRLTLDDAPFILRLVNEPSWLEFIGDKGVRTLEDARGYLARGPLDMYARLGYGLYLTELRDGAIPIGICGLIKRDSLPDVDVGFAFVPEHWGHGYGYEAASSVLAYGEREFAIKRIVAITSPGNRRSIRMLERLGMVREQTLELHSDGRTSLLFARNF